MCRLLNEWKPISPPPPRMKATSARLSAVFIGSSPLVSRNITAEAWRSASGVSWVALARNTRRYRPLRVAMLRTVAMAVGIDM